MRCCSRAARSRSSLQVRGSLLPDDERLLAEQWLLVDRSVFEVESVHPGQASPCATCAPATRTRCASGRPAASSSPGSLICARVVPAGDTMQFFGGLEPVALHERDRLIDLLDTEPDPVELVAYLSRRFAPPTLTNTEGDPLAICEATVRVGDPDADRGRTRRHLRPGRRRRAAALASNTSPPMACNTSAPPWCSTATRCGSETNSEKRMDRVLATLVAARPRR